MRSAVQGVAVLAVAALLAACPSDKAPVAAGLATFCNSLTGTSVVTLGATSTASGLRFSIASVSGIYPSVLFSAALPGSTLEAVTYDETNAAASTRVDEAATGGVTWVQGSTVSVDTGSFSLALTDAGEALSIDGGLSWPAPQGCLSVTLLPVGTATDGGLGLVVNAPPTASFCPCP